MDTRPGLCLTVTGTTMAELRARRDAVDDADLVEMRLDSVADPDPAGAVAGRRVPVILTCRPAHEGGWFRGSEEERHRILLACARTDAEFVDVEWQARFDDVAEARQGRGLVCSFHDFSGMPADLETRLAAMQATGATVVKAAVTVSRLAQCATLLDIGRRLAPANTILLGMGDPGVVTRVHAARFGSPWSYAGEGVAPGQFTLAQMTKEYGFGRIHAGTAIYGLIGRPIGHSLSPAMHNAAFEALGRDAVYLPLCPADMDDVAAFVSAFGVRGVSVTAPFKTDVLRLADEISEAARVTGAANTLSMAGGLVAADNLDLDAFLAPLDDVALAGSRAAVLGNGGAARAAAVALRGRGAAVTIYGRNAGLATAVAAEVGVAAACRPVPPGSWDVLVNTTPVGTFPQIQELAFPEGHFDGGLAYDLVYNPPETAFLRAARHAGCRTIGGLEMLVAQACAQQERWGGRKPPADVLRDAALWKLSTCVSAV
jgi:3-dehydroquinate dehydratase / shikimate dehydrogenase